MKNATPRPPKWAERFLEWFCREDLHDAIRGDLEELYDRNYKKYGPRKAAWLFFWHTVLFFQPFAFKKTSRLVSQNATTMFRYNLLFAYRHFLRNKSSFLINLIGLSTGLACALLIYLWVLDELAIDKFHSNGDHLYQVLENRNLNEQIETSFQTSGPMADFLRTELPEVEYATAVAPATWPGFENFTLSVGDKNVRAAGQYVGKDYFHIFSFTLLQGDKGQVLSDKHTIVLSEELARNLFQTTEGIIGKVVEFQHEQPYTVSGIFKGAPANSSIQFDFVLPFESLIDTKPWVNDWGSSGPEVYVVLAEGARIEDVNNKIAALIKTRFPENTTRYPFLQRFSDIYLHGTYANGVQSGGRIEYVRLFSFIAFFILLIACINFMNLSTAKASHGLKEIGVKKVIGANRKSLISQYITESMLMVVFSFLLAVFIVLFFLPEFNQITNKALSLDLNVKLISSALTIALCTGIVAGSYPAFYLSRFKPINVLKGNAHTSLGGAWVRKGLVVFQFALSIILIVSVAVIYKQIEFIQYQHLGYDRDNVIWFNLEGKLAENPQTFLTASKRVNGVVNAAATAHRMVGHNWSSSGIEWEGSPPDHQTQFQIVGVGHDFIETMGVEIIKGRSFSQEFGAEGEKVIFNEAAIEAMGLQDPVGKTIHSFMGEKEIIGIAKDFHFESFHQEVKPLFFTFFQHGLNKIMVKIEAGKEEKVLAGLAEVYEHTNPGFDFDYHFLDEAYQAQYVAEQRISMLSRYFAGLAILISCLGLFGLAAFTAQKRLKEISIRKILGSSIWSIVALLSTDFTKMVLVAIFIALPVSYLIAYHWLEGFAYKIKIEWWYFAGSALAALLIAWLTISFQTLKVARINPVECLGEE